MLPFICEYSSVHDNADFELHNSGDTKYLHIQ